MRDKLWVLALALIGVAVVVFLDLGRDDPAPRVSTLPAAPEEATPVDPEDGDEEATQEPVAVSVTDADLTADAVRPDPLEQRVSFSFSGAKFVEIVRYVASTTGANIVLSPDAADAAENVPVTLTLSDVPARAALETLVRVAGLGLEDLNGIVYIDIRRGRVPRGAAKTGGPDDAALSDALRTGLSTRTSANFQETSPADILGFLNLLMKSSGATVVLSPGAAALVADETVTFVLDDASIASVLQILARQLGLELRYEGDAVLLVPPGK